MVRQDSNLTIDAAKQQSGYQQVFTNCNVCGRALVYVGEDVQGMCNSCAGSDWGLWGGESFDEKRCRDESEFPNLGAHGEGGTQ